MRIGVTVQGVTADEITQAARAELDRFANGRPYRITHIDARPSVESGTGVALLWTASVEARTNAEPFAKPAAARNQPDGPQIAHEPETATQLADLDARLTRIEQLLDPSIPRPHTTREAATAIQRAPEAT